METEEEGEGGDVWTLSVGWRERENRERHEEEDGDVQK